MFPGTCHSLLWTCFIAVTCAQLPTPVEQKVITAESGQSVTLPCHAPSNKILLLEWTRPDLAKEEYVFLFRDQQFNPANQHRSFNNRVDLKDRQMKNGDVSLILKNVTINDTGTYECRVLQRETNRRKRANLDTDPISIIDLSVVPPGQTHTEDGGEKSGSVGLIAGVLVAAVLLVAAVSGYLIYRKHKKQNQDSYQPPVEMHHV